MAFESALILSLYLPHANDITQIPALLKTYNDVRFPRTSKVDGMSRSALDYLKMSNGAFQVERDRSLLDGSSEGCPFAIVNPTMQNWL